MPACAICVNYVFTSITSVVHQSQQVTSDIVINSNYQITDKSTFEKPGPRLGELC